MKTASKTLVKSQPELWALIDQPNRMQGLMCALLGRATEVTVSEREPESVLSWEAANEKAWIKVELAEKGWGTHVEVSAETATEPVRLDGWLDAVLEELATPEKRPFEGMTETPSGTVAEAASARPSETEPDASAAVETPAEKAPAEESRRQEAPQLEESRDEEPSQETPTPDPEPAPKKRFFGLF